MAKRNRKQVVFWLDLLKDESRAVWEIICELKSHRLFSQAVRDGLILSYELYQGKLDYLKANFPGVHSFLIQQVREELYDEIRELEAQRKFLEDLKRDWGNDIIWQKHEAPLEPLKPEKPKDDIDYAKNFFDSLGI